MNNISIAPTHTCFDDAMEMLEEAVINNPGSFESDELKLVHAICLTPDGREYSHAWVESDDKYCWFKGIMNRETHQFAASIKEYYEEIRVKETIKYSPRKALNLNHQYNNYGPWEERYISLCRKHDTLPAVPKP